MFIIKIFGNNFVMENTINKLTDYYQKNVKKKLVKGLNEKSLSRKDNCLHVTNFAGMLLKNKYAVCVMTDAEFFDNNGAKESYFNFYKQMAKTGVGLIVTGGIYDAYQHQKSMFNPSVCLDDSTIERWSEFTREIHSFGSAAVMKIKPNFGRGTPNYKLLNILPCSASFNKNFSNSKLICARLSDGRCNEIVSRMKNVTLFARRANFDAVMIDGGFDEILGEFSSKEFNRRIFGYYSAINELAEKCIKEVAGMSGNIPIIYKINLQSFIDDVYKYNRKEIKSLDGVKNFTNVNDVLKLIKHLIEAGVDAFYFEIGNFETEFLNESFSLKRDGLFDDYFNEIINYIESLNLKNKFGTPVGFIVKYDECINIKNDNLIYDITKNIYADCDCIMKEKTQKHIKKCIKCNKCIDFKQKYAKNECVINPKLKYNLLPIGNTANESIAIVGGGIAGLVCALTIVKRGGKCDLYEKEDVLNLFGEKLSVFGYDEELKNYNNYLKCEILKNAKNGNINIKTCGEIIYDANFIKKYNIIIIATGSKEKFLSVNGAIQKHVVSIYDFLKSKPANVFGKSVAVYAKTELSLKLAIYLAQAGARLSLIIDSETKLLEIPNVNFTFYLTALKELNVDIVIISKIKKINDDSVEVFVNNKLKNKDVVATILNFKSKHKYSYLAELKTVDANLFIYEPELVPNNKLYYDLVKNKFSGQVYLIGDALEVGDLEHSIKTGFFVGNNI